MLALKVSAKSLDFSSKLCLTVGCIFGSYILGPLLADKSSPEFLTPAELIQRNGYPAEVHKVITKDGFILEHHRIPNGKYSNKSKGPPVILQHGFLCASDFWILNGAKRDLAFILADAGFDVWLTNYRGGAFSEIHEAYRDTQRFNDFSFHEFGQIDLARTVDYILQTTGRQNVSYVGHSLGTLMLSVLLSTKPEYNSKINYFVAIAPVWKKTPFIPIVHQLIENFWYYTGTYYEVFDKVNIFERTNFRNYLSYYLFGNNPMGQILEYGPNFLISHTGGSNTTRKSSISTSVKVAKFPTGLSHFTLKHYHELMDYDEFRMRDYGPEKNLMRYNSSKPPNYDTTLIKTPTTIYYSNEDTLADPKTVHWAASQLENLERIINVPGFNHFDLIWADDASAYYFYDIVDILRSRLLTYYH